MLYYNIKLIRELQDMTQGEFATKLGVSKDMVYTYEKGKAEPSELTKKRIAKMAGIELTTLEKDQLKEEDLKINRQDKAPKEPMTYTPISATDQGASMAHAPGQDQKSETLEDAVKALLNNSVALKAQAAAIEKLAGLLSSGSGK